MVQIKEFQIVMPMSLEEYQVAQACMVTRMQQQSRNDTEGVDVLENRPFKDDQFGEGQYTSKVYCLQNKVPSWLMTFTPVDALILEEEAWNAYPRCKTVIKCPYFTKFHLTVKTIHTDENGLLDNNKCNPVMTASKLVTIDAPYWGFGYRLEQAMLSGERALFIESHKNCLSWIDEWYGLTLQQVCELDCQNQGSIKPSSGNASEEKEFYVGQEDFYSERAKLQLGQPIQVDTRILN